MPPISDLFPVGLDRAIFGILIWRLLFLSIQKPKKKMKGCHSVRGHTQASAEPVFVACQHCPRVLPYFEGFHLSMEDITLPQRTIQSHRNTLGETDGTHFFSPVTD